MEGLLKLEKLQRMMELMESHGIVNSSNDNNPNSNLFLANFALFLVQTCSELDMEEKCQLISGHIAKISTSFFEEALQWVGEEGDIQIEDPLPLHYDDEPDLDPSKSNFQEAATVGLDAMHRANSTLEDFCRSYFMFHDMDVHQPHLLFKYLPILSFTESYIYQLDTLNEELLQSPTTAIQLGERESDMDCQAKQRCKVLKMLKTDPFRPLAALLERQGLLTERIREELRSGVEYWTLERKLCSSSLSTNEITIGDVMRAVRMKSFDYRVLNLLLYQLRREKVNELHMEFLSISEFLVELSDDLSCITSYFPIYGRSMIQIFSLIDDNVMAQDDVLENNFNVLRMFVRIYGASTAPMMLAKCITEAEEKYENLLKSLDPELSMNYQKRCEEATKEGGKTSGPSLGTWNIPAIIQDEDLYRSKISNSKQSSVVQAQVHKFMPQI